MAVQVELSRILIRELNDFQIIELRESLDTSPGGDGGGGSNGTEENSARSFPIVIGLPEAQAIERRLKGMQVKRPQTHDLLANVIADLGGTLVSITITDLTDQTFFATLDIRRPDGETMHIDSRPSDAIALGVAGGVPIYVEEHVFDSASEDLL